MASSAEVTRDQDAAAIGGSLLTDSRSGVPGSTAADAGTTPKPGSSQPPFEAGPEDPTERTEAFDGYVADIRTRLSSDIPFLFPRLEDLIRRRLGLAPLSAGAAALAGLVGVGIRLALALVATALVGQWAGVPWGRWVLILAFYGLFDATQPTRTPPLDVPSGPRFRRMVEDWTALLPNLVREPDLQDLANFTRRWGRLPVAAAIGVAVAATMLGACWLFTPTAMSELPAGSIVLLAILLYDFGAVTVNPLDWALISRQARYDHHLFWPSPVDSPEVQNAVRMTNFFGLATGMWITLYLVLSLVMVSWDSPLVLPLAVGFIVIGYLTTICSTIGWRASIEKIVQRSRHQRLLGLQRRIQTFEPRYSDLSPQESEHVRGLIELHNMIRDAPTTPTTTHTLIHASVGLIIPSIMFAVAVFGEVYAERILDAILP
ncbi:MAG: hypothetical protein OEX97_04485 [Acidimicrobiia bacterium]|nr:hypothetical protein [Acidimicrobiia bacterium]